MPCPGTAAGAAGAEAGLLTTGAGAGAILITGIPGSTGAGLTTAGATGAAGTAVANAMAQDTASRRRRVCIPYSYRTRWRIYWRRARLDEATLAEIRRASRRIFALLQLRDYARLDFRLTDEGRLVFIEANPNSDLTPNTLGRNLCFVGIEYRDLIPLIVETARKRCRTR